MSIRISFLKLSEFFFFMMLLYFQWFQYAFFEIPFMMVFTGAGMLGFLALHYYLEDNRLVLPVPGEYVWWLLFFAFAFATGLFLAASKPVFIELLSTSFQYLLIGYAVFLIAAKEKDLDFLIKALLITYLLAAATTILFPVEDPQDPGRFTMGLTNNANTLGIGMMIGIFCALYLTDFKKIPRTIFLFTAIIAMTYTIILTGSRKSLIALVILLVLWLIFSLPKLLKFIPPKRRIVVLGLVLLLIGIAGITLIPLFMDSILINRMISLFTVGSTDERIPMYKEAMVLFRQHPLAGIGFGQFSVVSQFGTYSHSTYAEALSCTGLTGAVLYFGAYSLVFFKLLHKARSLERSYEVQHAYQWLAMLFILLFLAAGIIHFYEIDSYIVFGLMFAFANLDIKDRRQENQKGPKELEERAG